MTTSPDEYREELRERAQEYVEAQAVFLTAQDRLHGLIRQANRILTKAEIARLTGLSQMTIHRVTNERK